MKKLIYIYLIMFLFTSCECERDPIDAGITTQVNGNVFDLLNDIPFTNYKLKIGEYKIKNAGIYSHDIFIQWIDSTYTDNNGDYNLPFTTSGLGAKYKLHIEEVEDIWTVYYDPIEITNIGGTNVYDLNFYHFYPVNLIISVNNLTVTPVYVYNYYNYGLDEIDQPTGVFNRLLYLNRKTANEVVFSIDTDPNNYYSDHSDIKQYTVTIPATNSTTVVDIPVTLQDSDFN